MKDFRQELTEICELLETSRELALRWPNIVEVQRSCWSDVDSARAAILTILNRLEDDHR